MSLHLQENCSLKAYNTFGLDAQARWFVQAHNDQQMQEALLEARQRQVPLIILGGGSNVLLTADLEALVLHVASRGIRLLPHSDESVLVEAEAGENWHDLVEWSLQRGLAGLENLSLIPGTVGAAPVQNIGAYGVELKDVLAGLTALHLETGQIRNFTLEDCAFAYRESFFKRQAGRWLILRVRLALTRQARLHLDYGPVRQALAKQGIEAPTPRDVARVICQIRREKLPDPAQLGNAGSFFKNPLVSAQQATALRESFSDLVSYPQADGREKLAAGWLIDKAGWKAYRQGPVGVHAQQALVLVNYGGATGAQVLELAQRIREDIQQRFGVCLEMEPSLY